MTRKNFFLALIMSVLWIASVSAQVARWTIHPCYEQIRLEEFSDVLIADSAGNQILWDTEGHRLYRTPYIFWNFNEQMALVMEPMPNSRKPSSGIKGIVTDQGKYTTFDAYENRLTATYGDPFFHNGQLLVQEPDKTYRFIDTDGRMSDLRLSKAFPFRNGFAACETYKKWDKKKDCYAFLLNDRMKLVNLTIEGEGKPVDVEDVQLVSSLNDEGIGIAVVKGKVYYFSANGQLIPLYAIDGDFNRKDQVEIKDVLLVTNEYGEPVLRGRSRKTHIEVSILFDKKMVPLNIKGLHIERTYKEKKTESKNRKKLLQVYANEGGLKEIWWGDDTLILQAQFDDVKNIYDNKAVVRMPDGKWGVTEVLENAKFNAVINDGKDIPFKHKTFEGRLRIDLPRAVASKNVSIEMVGQNDEWMIKPGSDIRYGDGFIEYDCILNIHDSLPDKLNEGNKNQLRYQITVNNDGLISPPITVKARAWHCVYFHPIFSEEVTIGNTHSFLLDIEIDDKEDQNYHLTVDVVGKDELQVDMEKTSEGIEKISENRYKCKLSNLQEGINNFEIHITEDGCPPQIVDYEVNYIRKTKKVEITPKHISNKPIYTPIPDIIGR